MGVAEGHEWEPLESVGDNARPGVEALIERSRIAREKRQRAFGQIEVPAIPAPSGDEQSTQAAFGRILLEIAKSGGTLADRIVTTSPDVTVSTNLGAWVNQRGLFRREGSTIFLRGKRLRPRKSGLQRIKASISSWHRRKQPVPDARGRGVVRRSIRNAAGADRDALRPLHRPRFGCAELRLLPGRAVPPRRNAERHDARARRRRAPVDQSAVDRARPARPVAITSRPTPTSSQR